MLCGILGFLPTFPILTNPYVSEMLAKFHLSLMEP
jgi:hypothetical protein